MESFRKNYVRNKRKALAKEQSMATMRRQMANVLYTEPAVLEAGQPVKIFYNPSNTSLNGSAEVRAARPFSAVAPSQEVT